MTPLWERFCACVCAVCNKPATVVDEQDLKTRMRWEDGRTAL